MKKAVVVSVAMLLCCFSGTARAATVNFYLTVDVVSHTWMLSASTDAAGGIAAFALKFFNTETGTSVAPQSFDGERLKGFQVGNFFYEYSNARREAFAAQYPLDVDSIVYRIGYTPVPNSAFGKDGAEPVSMIGDATTVPTLLYTGTYDPAGPLPDFAPPDTPYSPVAAVFIEPPVGGYDRPVLPDEIQYFADTVHYSVSIVPEPGAYLLAAIGFVFMLTIFQRRFRKQHLLRRLRTPVQ